MAMVRGEIRLRGYSIRTEKSYLFWIKQFILFHQKRHPNEMGAAEVKVFLTWLAVKRNVAINTQKVALNALVFLYAKVLKVELGDLDFALATKQRYLPSVLTPDEVLRILNHLQGRDRLIIEMLYASGLRITECLCLRVQDIDFSAHSICVRDAKGNKDRQTLLSASLVKPLQSAIDVALNLQKKITNWVSGLPYLINWRVSIAMRFVRPRGCLYFHPPSCVSTQFRVFSVVIIYMTRWCAKHYKEQLCWRA
ncbi:phage integrase family site specific recombinase [Cellvibrio sp. BR]|nr:phage integrase family site specific recombinase [Cellvibrio sp. BR]